VDTEGRYAMAEASYMLLMMMMIVMTCQREFSNTHSHDAVHMR